MAELPGPCRAGWIHRTSGGSSGLGNRIIAWADGLQRRHGVLGFPYAAVKKYGDDEGGRQAALITYCGFLSIFRLLLLGVAVLSRVLARSPGPSGGGAPHRHCRSVLTPGCTAIRAIGSRRHLGMTVSILRHKHAATV